MRYNEVSNWLQSGVHLGFKSGELGKVTLCVNPPSAAALDGADQADLSSGWPVEIVDKARAIRGAQKLVWSKDGLIHIGDDNVPLSTFFGTADQHTWLNHIPRAVPVPRLAAAHGWGYTLGGSGTPGAIVDARNGIPTSFDVLGNRHWTLDALDPERFMEEVTGFVFPSGTIFSVVTPTVVVGWGLRHCIEATSDQVIEGHATVSAPWFTAGVWKLVVAHVPHVGPWQGVEMLVYTLPVSGQVAYGLVSTFHLLSGTTNERLAKWHFRLGYIRVDENWGNILSLSRTFVDLPESYHGGDHPTVTSHGDGAFTPFLCKVTTGVAQDPDFGIFAGSLSPVGGVGFPGAAGIRVYRVYTWGLPSNVTGLSVLYNGVVSQQGRLVLDDGFRVYSWRGSTLVALHDADPGTSLSTEQRASLGRLVVRTAIAATEWTTPADPLSVTRVWDEAGEQGQPELAASQFVEATETEEQLTFAAASSRASLKRGRVWHLLGDSSSQVTESPNKVTLSGTAATGYRVTVTVRTTGAVVPGTDDDALVEVLNCAEVVNSTDLTMAAAMMAVFGVNGTTVSDARVVTNKAEDEFREVLYSQGDLWHPARLSVSQQGAYAMMNYARSRQQLDSFISSCLTMGRLANRYAG